MPAAWGAAIGVAGSVLSSQLNSGPSGTTTTSNTNPASPFLGNLYNWSTQLAQNNQPQYYPGPTLAGFTPAQGDALNRLAQFGQQGSPAIGAATNFNTNLTNGGFLFNNPSNPTLSAFSSGAMANPMSNPAFNATIQNTLSQVIPGITSKSVAGGNLNNPAGTFAAGQGAMGALAPYISNIYQQGQQNQLNAATTLGNQWNTGVGLMNQGSALTPSLVQLGLLPAQTEFSAGSAQQAQNQAGINADMARFNYNQDLPFTMNSWLSGILGSNPGSATTSPYFQNAFANAGTGAAAGAGIGNWLSGSGGAGSNPGVGGANTLGMFGANGTFGQYGPIFGSGEQFGPAAPPTTPTDVSGWGNM